MSNPRPQQTEFISDFRSQFIAMVGGNRCGKTWGGSEKAFWLSKMNGSEEKTIGVAVEPTYDMVNKYLRPAIQNIFDYYGVYVDYHKQDHIFSIPEFNNSLIYLYSADAPKRIESVEASWVWGDEPAQYKPEVFSRILTRMNDKKAKIMQTFLTGTPEGFNHYHKELFSLDSKTGKNKYRVILGSLDEIRLNTDDGYVDRLESFLDPLLLREKLYGEFLNTTSGRVFYAFTEDLIIPFYQFDRNLPLRISCDFNINPCIWNIHQYRDGKIFTFDEIVMYNANTQYMCDKLNDWLSKKPAFPKLIFYGDYTSTFQRTTQTSLTDWIIIENNFKNYPGYDTKLKVNPRVKARVEAQNGLLSHKKWYFTPNCRYAIDDHRQVVWSANGIDLDKRDKDRTHACDGCGYMANYDFGLDNIKSGTF
jgi:hypothetical protein